MKYLYLSIFLFATTITFGQITWSKKNGPFGGQMVDVEVHPTTSTLYAIGQNSLAYRSTDDGSTWSDLKPPALVANFEIGNISDIWIQSDGTVWLLTYSNLYKSTDDGLTWSKVNTGSGSSNSSFDSGYRIFKNAITGTLYVSGYHSTDGKYTLFRSTNGGASWTKGGQTHQYSQLVTASNGNVYALDFSGMYKSTNDGVNFSAETTPVDVVSSSVSLTAKSDGSQVNVVTGASAVYSMVSPFTTWVPMIETGIVDPLTFGPDAVIRYTPDNSTLLLIDNTNNKFYTKSSAGSWVPQTTSFPSADGDNAYQLVAKNATSYYVGTSNEGVWKTFNSGVGWSEISTGINSITQGNGMVVADNGNVIAGGPRPFISTNNGDSWDRAFPVTTQYSQFTPIKATTGSPKPIVMLNENAASKKSINNGVTWTDIAQAPTGRFASPNGTKILAYDNSTFYYSANQGTSWTASLTLTGMPTGSISYQYVAMDNSTIPIVYAALYDYTSGSAVLKFYKITLNSATPTTGAGAAIALSTIGVTDIRNVIYYNNAIYVLGSSSTGSPILSITTNGGTSWVTKTAPTNSYNMYIDPGTGYIFMARENNNSYNVYLSRDNGDSYITTSISIPTDRVNMFDIEVDPNIGYAYAGFDNAPAYRTDASVIIPTAPTSLASGGASTDRVMLKWLDNATNENDYIIEKQVGASFVEVTSVGSGFNSGMTLHAEVPGLTPNTSYTFRVAAKNPAGLSTYATVTFSTLASCASTIPDNRSWNGNVNGTTVLTNVGIVSKGNGVYSITDVSNGADGQGGTKPMLFTESCNSTYLQYDYPLYANGNGTWTSGTKTLVLKWTTEDVSPIIGTVTLITNATDPAPATPAAASATVFDASTIEVAWTPSLFATSFTVERSISNTFASVQQTFPVNYPAATYKDNTALVIGTTYYYRIKAVNAAGTSLPTPIVTVVFDKPNFVLSGTPIETVVGTNSAGAVWGDFNNDGFDDLIFTQFLIQPGVTGIPLMYKNNGAGNFTVVGSESGIEPSQYLPAAIADYDNDGNLDIFFASSGSQNYLYKGNGDFTFTKQVTPMDVNTPNDFESLELATTWFDFNNDGLLDLTLSKQDNSVPIRYFVQSPAGTFTQVVTGDLANLKMSGGVVLWADYDNDGKQDLFVPENSSAPNRLFKNNGDGTLTKVTGAPFDTDLATRSFGAAWGDYNNDGFLDLFITTGSDGTSNLLYKNNGNGSFTKQVLSPITDPKVGDINSYCAVWADINNDTFLDLIVANIGGENYLFVNNGAGGFTKVLYEKVADPRFFNFSVAAADYNHDGFIDLAFSSLDPQGFESTAPVNVSNLLFKNINTTGNWVELKLKGISSNRSAVGARVTIVAGGKTLIREVQSTTSFISQNSSVVHFGLGAAISITSVEIKWPSGVVQPVTGILVNTISTITENGDPEPPVFTDVTGLPASSDKSALAQTITVSITDNKAVTTATMHVKPISGSTFTIINGAQTTAPQWNFAVPATAFDAIGIEYFFQAKDAAQNLKRNPLTGTYKTQVKYTGTQAQIPANLIGTGGANEGWKVIAVPFDLGANNGVQVVFDELTAADPALVVKEDYRILTYTETPSPAWQDYPAAFSTIDRGAGYFINVRTPVNLIVGDNLVAPNNTRSNLFTIDLKAGWNMIGNPYLEPIDWGNVVTLNTLSGTAATFKRFSGGAYGNATAIAAYEGGFVHADAAIQISIPFNGQTTPGRIGDIDFGPHEWIVPISVQQGELINTFGGVGMHSKASMSFDLLDDINGPHWIEFTEMNFQHPEHMVKNFARDVVPVMDEFVWSFTVDSNVPGVATLKWDTDIHQVDEDIYLYDEATQTPVNMKETSSYSFESRVPRQFKVYYGHDALSKIKPAKVMLGLAYPNPTSNSATVPFSVPEKNGNAWVSVQLDVFDMTGRKVGTVVNGQFAPGFYIGQWEAQAGLSNGVYFYRLLAGDEILTGKVVLKK